MRFTRILAVLAAATVALPLTVAADSVIVVPGKYAGHLYTGTSTGADDGLISLAVFKRGDFYNYRIESEPVGYLCDINCSEKAMKIKGGRVKLKIVGNKPVPGVTIPLTGRWEAPCDTTTTDTDTCYVSPLTALNAQVRVSVDPTVEAGTIIPTRDGDVMFVRFGADHILVANHLNPGAIGQPFLNPDRSRTSLLGASDVSDGRNNMNVLVAAGSAPAIYCAGLGNNWYLPARDEMAALTTKAVSKVSNGKGGWSSTEYSLVYTAPKNTATSSSDSETWVYKIYASSSGSSVSNTTAYEDGRYRDKKSTNWYESTNVNSNYQALCFKRLPLQ